MTLRIIGSGFGRTGTTSMKEALTQLGFGPCHHMSEALKDPQTHMPKWRAVFSGEQVDWDEVFAGFEAQVDWPGAHVWPQTMRAFPEAKVIHTERPSDGWWESFNQTIGKFFRMLDDLDLPPEIAELFAVMKGGIMLDNFDDFTDRDSAIATYERNNARVREEVPADRLLVFDVRQGWAPLCEFLDVPVPQEAFPNRFPKREFWELLGGEPEG
ncbi:sulfotransferase family protein [Roseovarius pelagicus]|uniref:Sulfotransferase family protein n=1 Tax=Roseovarius pelagicus TaxID=2980108 RepID=A0ABY6DBH1_9RHOB|nr:sulfotransferase family protein [Roseovarius pelagicus]UXX83481.1 hypothetical protein N7U68_02010 [Roseovarius pelagicus]